MRLEAPELEGPKVVDKIDLSNIDSSTRPRKVAKKNRTSSQCKRAARTGRGSCAGNYSCCDRTGDTEEAITNETAEVETAQVIENIKADKLEGPKDVR